MLPRTFLVLGFCLLTPALRAAEFVEVSADPAVVSLRGPTARFTLLVHGRTTDGRLVDLTRIARYRSADPKIVAVDLNVIVPVADGKTTVIVDADGKSIPVAVTVSEAAAARRFNFENDVMPVLSRFGCNSSGCHGKAEGQNGFKLSVFGFDPPADFAALTKEGRGRRVFPPAPEQSLLLRKMSGQVPHGGGAPRAAHLCRLRDAARLDRRRDTVRVVHRSEGDGGARRAAQAHPGRARLATVARYRHVLRWPRS